MQCPESLDISRHHHNNNPRVFHSELKPLLGQGEFWESSAVMADHMDRRSPIVEEENTSLLGQRFGSL
ncbi:hypothetical protein SLA2020_383040 [Shorea laevis]